MLDLPLSVPCALIVAAMDMRLVDLIALIHHPDARPGAGRLPDDPEMFDALVEATRGWPMPTPAEFESDEDALSAQVAAHEALIPHLGQCVAALSEASRDPAMAPVLGELSGALRAMRQRLERSDTRAPDATRYALTLAQMFHTSAQHPGDDTSTLLGLLAVCDAWHDRAPERIADALRAIHAYTPPDTPTRALHDTCAAAARWLMREDAPAPTHRALQDAIHALTDNPRIKRRTPDRAICDAVALLNLAQLLACAGPRADEELLLAVLQDRPEARAHACTHASPHVGFMSAAATFLPAYLHDVQSIMHVWMDAFSPERLSDDDDDPARWLGLHILVVGFDVYAPAPPHIILPVIARIDTMFAPLRHPGEPQREAEHQLASAYADDAAPTLAALRIAAHVINASLVGAQTLPLLGAHLASGPHADMRRLVELFVCALDCVSDPDTLVLTIAREADEREARPEAVVVPTLALHPDPGALQAAFDAHTLPDTFADISVPNASLARLDAGRLDPLVLRCAELKIDTRTHDLGDTIARYARCLPALMHITTLYLQTSPDTTPDLGDWSVFRLAALLGNINTLVVYGAGDRIDAILADVAEAGLAKHLSALDLDFYDHPGFPNGYHGPRLATVEQLCDADVWPKLRRLTLARMRGERVSIQARVPRTIQLDFV